MPYDFSKDEFEFEPQASSAHGSGPPRKRSGIGVLEPPIPPNRPLGPIPSIPSSLLVRILTVMLLAGLAAATLMLLFGKH